MNSHTRITNFLSQFCMQCRQLSAAVILSVIISITAKANKDSTIQFFLPDSVKASSFVTDVHIGTIKTKKEINAGIRIGDVSVSLGTEKNKNSQSSRG